LANIRTRLEKRLKQLDVDYETWDKAKISFGYIGITFLVVLFCSIFGNDLRKLLIHYFNHLSEWWREKKEQEEEKRKQDEATCDEIKLEIDQSYAHELEESLERVYFELVKVTANNRKNNEIKH